MIRSYSNLEPKQQEIFLDLACFFLRLHHTINVSDLKFLLKDDQSGNSAVSDPERLKQKALITFSEDNCVSMHDVLQEMALAIVRGESIKDPGSRSRLWDLNDMCEVLKTGKVSEDIRSIQIDFSEFKELKSISDQIFIKMSRLHFLEISWLYDCYNQHCILAKGLQCLPSELRFLCWHGYPLKSLPEIFSVEKLVILSLQCGRMEKLWDGVKNLVNLKVVDLSDSGSLKKLPDLSKATNLEVLNLTGCHSLTGIHSYIFYLLKLEKLHLEFSGIKVLPSFGHQSKLKSLSLFGSKIEMLPSSFKNFTQVLHLDVSDCWELQTILELPPMVETLDASSCTSLLTIRKLPHSLKTQNVKYCTSLQTLLELPQVLETLDVSYCDSVQTIPMLPMSLETLDSRVCHSLKTVLFPSKGVDQLTECRRRCLFSDLPSLDEPSLVAIGLNAQINMMTFANQHISTKNHNHVENYDDYDDDNYDSYQAVYVYPGSSVPEWLEYKTTNNYISIDLSSAPPCPLISFIFCFVLGDYAAKNDCDVMRFEVNIAISDGEDEDENDSVKIFSRDFCCSSEIDNVHVIYDQRCSAFLNSRAKNQTRFKIKVTMETLCSDFSDDWAEDYYDLLPQHALKGLGISPISTLEYDSFIQQMFCVTQTCLSFIKQIDMSCALYHPRQSK